MSVSYTHLRAHETVLDLACRLLLEKKKDHIPLCVLDRGVHDKTSYELIGDNAVYATTVYNGNLIAGGSFSSAGGVAASNIAEWNGSAWMPLGTGVNGQVDALIEYNNELIVGGRFTNAGGVEVLFLAKWNGIEWSDVNGDMGNIVVSLAVYQNNLIVGGYFRDADDFPADYIVGFNGEWFNLGVGMGGSQGQVMALTVHNNELYAGGFFTSAGGSPAAHIAKWNGTVWDSVGSIDASISFQSLGSYNNKIYAGAFFGGLYIYENDSWSWIDTSNSPIPGMNVNDVAFDSVNSILWIATNKGLAKVQNDSWQIFDSTNSELGANDLTCLSVSYTHLTLPTSDLV